MSAPTSPVDKPTKRQAAALNFIANYIVRYGYPPTIREIGDAMSIRSTNGVNDHLKALERKGYIKRTDTKSRAIRPLFMANGKPFDQWLQEKTKKATLPDSAKPHEVQEIPLVGHIAAGTPISAIENLDETLLLDQSLLEASADIFALRVRGDSMINDGILDNDIIFVKKTADAPNGSIVAALIDGEATVKRYYHEGDRVRLQPANDLLEPIYITPAMARESAIMGSVIGLFRTV